MTSHIRVGTVGQETDFAQKGKKWKLLRRTMMMMAAVMRERHGSGDVRAAWQRRCEGGMAAVMCMRAAWQQRCVSSMAAAM